MITANETNFSFLFSRLIIFFARKPINFPCEFLIMLNLDLSNINSFYRFLHDIFSYGNILSFFSSFSSSIVGIEIRDRGSPHNGLHSLHRGYNILHISYSDLRICCGIPHAPFRDCTDCPWKRKAFFAQKSENIFFFQPTTPRKNYGLVNILDTTFHAWM